MAYRMKNCLNWGQMQFRFSPRSRFTTFIIVNPRFTMSCLTLFRIYVACLQTHYIKPCACTIILLKFGGALVEAEKTDPDLWRGPRQFRRWHNGRLGLTEVGIKASEGNDSKENEQEQLDKELWGRLLVVNGFWWRRRGFCLATLQCWIFKTYSGTRALKMTIGLQFKRKCKCMFARVGTFFFFVFWKYNFFLRGTCDLVLGMLGACTGQVHFGSSQRIG